MRVIAARRHVIVGVDGAPNSIAALHHAGLEANRHGARLDVIHIIGNRRAGELWPARTLAWLRLRDLVARRLPRSQHVTTRLRIAYGSPTEVLIRAAKRAERLVLGAREHSEEGNLFGGETVPRVLSGAPCEVVVCADHAIRVAV
jgi:nucleotide-binding universal stress UspA family protein